MPGYDGNEIDRFLIVWDMYGLERAVNMDEIHLSQTEAILKGEHSGYPNLNGIINFHQLRARLNSHRNYEIYAIGMPSGTTVDDIVEMFKRSPQTIADLIRENGLKLHGNRNNTKPVIY